MKINNRKFTRFFLLVLFLLSLNAPIAATGVRDRAFGNNGTAASGWVGTSVSAEIIVQPDDKILVGGVGFSSTGSQITIARYNAADGSLDSTFDGGITRRGRQASFSDMALQSDGKILVVGDSDFPSKTPGNVYYIARTNADGSRDLTFGINGEVQIDRSPGGALDTLFSVLPLPDGKILAAGRIGGNMLCEILRRNPDGSEDRTFATNGYLFFTQPAFQTVRSLRLTSEGKILGIGTTASSGAMIFRLNADGTTDTTFGQNGFVQVSSSESLTLQPDGKIISRGANDLRRFLPNGQLDSTFKISSYGGQITLLPNGRIIAMTSDASSEVGRYIHLIASDGRLIGRIARPTPPPNGTVWFFANVGAQSNGRIIAAVSSRMPFVPTNPANFVLVRYNSVTSLANRIQDFDKDEATDVGIFRPVNNTFYYLLSIGNSGILSYTAPTTVNRPITEDFNGDFSSGFSWTTASQSVKLFCGAPGELAQCSQWGFATDKEIGGDYDGDNKTDFAVIRDGVWRIFQSSTQTARAVSWGFSSDLPVPADYDGDGKTDIAVFRPSNGTWYVLPSDGQAFAIQFGASNDRPVPADYDGDGRADIAVFRPSNGFWYLFQTTGGLTGFQFGASEDKPVPGDYDGDGKTDAAVWRPSNGYWYLLQSTQGFGAIQLGSVNDFPLSTLYSAY